jgi:tetrahydromethanopterin S-methyltransferase subunit F
MKHSDRIPFERSKLKVFPLEERKSLTRVEDILLDPDETPAEVDALRKNQIRKSAQSIRQSRDKGASVMLIYGAHLLRNGTAQILDWMMEQGWITHLATNGAGTIHDFEYAYLGRSTESVRDNVEAGTFGAWDETGRSIMLALISGALNGNGYGVSLGKFIAEDGCDLPGPEILQQALTTDPTNALAGAQADCLQIMLQFGLEGGFQPSFHKWKHGSILASAFQRGVPVSVHPGIGYDIITNHPMFRGSVVGRAAELDFGLFSEAVEGLDNGTVLSVGSAIMGPQVFEKSLSCVHNLRQQKGMGNVSGHSIHIVDLQDGGNWDWTQGEPPKSNPAYYLRFCKSYSRMGGEMHYIQCDNAAFIHHLYHQLKHA